MENYKLTKEVDEAIQNLLDAIRKMPSTKNEHKISEHRSIKDEKKEELDRLSQDPGIITFLQDVEKGSDLIEGEVEDDDLPLDMTLKEIKYCGLLSTFEGIVLAYDAGFQRGYQYCMNGKKEE